jgi:hypothetical protein
MSLGSLCSRPAGVKDSNSQCGLKMDCLARLETMPFYRIKGTIYNVWFTVSLHCILEVGSESLWARLLVTFRCEDTFHVVSPDPSSSRNRTCPWNLMCGVPTVFTWRSEQLVGAWVLDRTQRPINIHHDQSRSCNSTPDHHQNP